MEDVINPNQTVLKRNREDYEKSRKQFTTYDNGKDNRYINRYHMGPKQKEDPLPIFEVQHNLLSTLRDPDTHTLIVSGTTGCGKTTKIPQIIYNDYYKRGERVNIVCTQPRRVACMNIARKVAADMGVYVGGTVGYSIQNESLVSRETCIRFVTTGILLNQIVNKQDISEYTHIIVDEVHERDLDTDFLLCLLRQLVYEYNTRHDTSTKIIIMSATVDENVFADYFSKHNTKRIYEQRKTKKEPAELYKDTVKLLKTAEKAPRARAEWAMQQQEEDKKTAEQWRLYHLNRCREAPKYNAIKNNDQDQKADFQKESGQSAMPEADHNFGSLDQQKFGCPIIKLTKRLHPVECLYIDKIIGLLRKYFTDDYLKDSRNVTEPTRFLDNLKTRANVQTAQGYYNIREGEDLFSRSNVDRRMGSYKGAADNFEKDFTISFMGDWMYEMGRDLVFLIELLGSRGVSQFNEGSAHDKKNKKSILVFLPGLQEINTFTEYLKTMMTSQNEMEKEVYASLDIYHLHSSLKIEADHPAFKRPAPGRRKVILATNIAESSITISDISYVIDFGLYKELNYSSHNRMERLELKYASRASLEQRKGRAGRVTEGYCFRILTEDYFQNAMNNFINPEILRCPLEKVILKTKISGIGEPVDILRSCMNNPEDWDVGNAFRSLIDFGAISIPNNLNPSGKVTFIGRMVAQLPCALQISRIILMGYCFGVFEQALTICSVLNIDKEMFYMRHSFLNIMRDKIARHKIAREELNLLDVEDFSLFDMRTWQTKYSWSAGSNSDHIAYLNCFNTWLNTYRSELIPELAKYKLTRMDKKYVDSLTSQKKEEVKWSLRNFVNLDCLYLTFEQITDFKKRLMDMQLQKDYMANEFSGSEEDYEVLKIAITAGLVDQLARSTYSLDEVRLNKELIRNEKYDLTNSIIVNNAPTELLEKQESKTKVEYTFRKAGQLDGGLIDVDEGRIYMTYKDKVGLMSAIRRREGDSYAVDLDTYSMSKEIKDRLNKEYMSFSKHFYFFDPDDKDNHDVYKAKRIRVRFERAFYPYLLKFFYNNESAMVDHDSVCCNLVEPDRTKQDKYVMVSSNIDITTKKKLLTLKCNSAFESKYDMLQDLLVLLFYSYVSLVKYPGTELYYGYQVINKSELRKFSHFLSVQDLDEINSIRLNISQALTEMGLKFVKPNTEVRSQVMNLISRKRVEVNEQNWYLYRVLSYLNMLNKDFEKEDFNISEYVETEAFRQHLAGQPESKNLDGLIDYFSAENVNKDLIDYLPRITNTINDGTEVKFDLLHARMETLKVRILTERTRKMRLERNLAQITSDDFMQLPCICSVCDSVLFQVGHLKGITSNYERYGFFDLKLSNFLTQSIPYSQAEKINKNLFYTVWEGTQYQAILGDGYRELRQTSEYLVCTGCHCPYGLQTANEKIILPPYMFKVLLPNRKTIDFNKALYTNQYFSLVTQHEDAKTQCRTLAMQQSLRSCQICRTSFSSTSDLMKHLDKDAKHRMNEHRYLHNVHYNFEVEKEKGPTTTMDE